MTAGVGEREQVPAGRGHALQPPDDPVPPSKRRHRQRRSSHGRDRLPHPREGSGGRWRRRQRCRGRPRRNGPKVLPGQVSRRFRPVPGYGTPERDRRGDAIREDGLGREEERKPGAGGKEVIKNGVKQRSLSSFLPSSALLVGILVSMWAERWNVVLVIPRSFDPPELGCLIRALPGAFFFIYLIPGTYVVEGNRSRRQHFSEGGRCKHAG